MKYNIKIIKAGNLNGLNAFLKETNNDIEKFKRLVLSSKDDMVEARNFIKNLTSQEEALKNAKDILIKMSGLKVFDDEHKKRRDLRLNLNAQIQKTKETIKNTAINYFLDNAEQIIENSKASKEYKQRLRLNIEKIAYETIKGKSKKLKEALKIQLKILFNGLSDNAKDVKKKQEIISRFDEDLIRDMDYLISLPIEAIIPELENREIKQEQKIQQKADRLIKAQENNQKKQEPISQIKENKKDEFFKLTIVLKVKTDEKSIKDIAVKIKEMLNPYWTNDNNILELVRVKNT